MLKKIKILIANKLLACIFFNSRSTILCCFGLVYKHHLTQRPLSDNPILSKKQNSTQLTSLAQTAWLKATSSHPQTLGSQFFRESDWGARSVTDNCKRDRNKMFSLLNGENITEDIRSAISLKWVYILLDTSLEFSSVLGEFLKTATFFHYKSYDFWYA